MIENKYENLVEYDLSNLKKYSYSKLSTYNICPWAYYNIYILGNRGKDNGFSVAGKVAHNLIDDFYNGKYLDFELKDVFEKKWQTEFLDFGYRVEIIFPDYKKDLTDSYKEKFSNYFENFKCYDNCKVIGTEIHNVMVLNNGVKRIIFEGVLDCLGVYGLEQYVIWDSKSKSKFKNKLELKNYLRQLYLYSIFIKHIYKKYPSKLAFNQFKLSEKDRVTEEIFNINDFNESVEWAFNTIDKIENDTMWLPTCDRFFADNLCGLANTCEFRICD